MQFESFEKKLYIARDVEENPNYDDLKIIREFEDRLSKSESFVGLAPFGSIVGGYSSGESDIDLYLFYDMANGLAEKDKIEDLLGVKEEIERSGKRKIHLMTRNINSKLAIHDLKLDIKIGNPMEYTVGYLADMAQVITGKKIDQYREIIKKELTRNSEEQKQFLKNEIVKTLTRRDRSSLSKRKTRIPELSEEQHQEILNNREIMWKKRVEKIWGLTGD